MTKKAINHSYYYSLEVENINCFKDKQTLDLSDGSGNYSPWTIILGDNGTGKTTLLKILDKVQPDDYEIDFKTLQIDITEKLYFPRYYYQGLSKDSDFKIDKLEESLSISVKTGDEIDKIYIGKFVEGKMIFYKENQMSMFVLSYGASRRMSKSQNLTSSISKFSSTLFDDGIELINAEEWFLQKSLKSLIADKKSKKKYIDEFELVKAVLKDALPDVNDIRIKPVNEDNSKILLEVKTNFGWVNLRDLSYGYQTITALIVDISANMMERYPDSKEPLKEPVIILIDEIDLHLHPKWQRTVIDKLSSHFPKAQFIVTAHSPLIVQVAQDKNANIVVCRKENDRSVIDNNPDVVKGWRIDQILISDLFNVDSSRSPEIEKFISEKNNILSKSELLEEDKKRLKLINKTINSIPNSVDKETLGAEDIIRRAAELLKK